MACFKLVNEKNPEKLPVGFKRAWVKALRSGKYRRGEGYLYQKSSGGLHPKHCCLGVAARVCGCPIDSINNRVAFIDSIHARRVPAILIGSGSIDKSVTSFLADMNDSGKKFSEIADYIEEYL